MVTPQPAPEQSLDQPMNMNGPVAACVNETFSSGLNGLMHVGTQVGGLPLGHGVPLPHTIVVAPPCAWTSKPLPSKARPSVSMLILTVSCGLIVKLAVTLSALEAV